MSCDGYEGLLQGLCKRPQMTGKTNAKMCIWAGKTVSSLPTVKVHEPAEKDGHIFTSGSDKHWSTFECMKEAYWYIHSCKFDFKLSLH